MQYIIQYSNLIYINRLLFRLKIPIEIKDFILQRKSSHHRYFLVALLIITLIQEIQHKR